MIELKNIRKTFSNLVANDNISLKIEEGEIFALLGENGAGKSTLMNILFGLYEADEGEILIDGKKVEIKNPLDANALKIGMVHQHFKLVENQSVTENIVLAIEPKKKIFKIFPSLDLKSAEDKVRELSDKFSLKVDPKALIEDLPVSVRQRVEILKMLYRDAKILIFDEPTAVLTPLEIDSLLQVIKQLRDQGKTIILITHKLDEIRKVASRCAVLRKGKLISISDIKNTSNEELSSLMVGRKVSLSFDKKAFNPGEKVLEVKNLSVKDKYNIDKLIDVSFNIRRGEILAVAGVAGNGQNQIAQAISGMINIAKGSIYLNGIDITKKRIKDRKGIAYIPEDRQKTALILDFDVSSNLCLKSYDEEPFCKKGILDFSKIRSRAKDLINLYDIRSANAEDSIIRDLSGGNQQKAIIAREIEENADLIIFVQPTRGLDIGAIENIHNKILDLRDQGKAILLISLELDEVISLADTILVMYNKRVSMIKDARMVSKQEIGRAMMGAGSV